MFKAQNTPDTVDHHRATRSRRASASATTSAARATTVLKGFYGRYYYNYADCVRLAEPGGANYKTFRFLDHERQPQCDGPAELWPARRAPRAARRTTVDPNMKKPYADEFDAVGRTPVLGRVVGARGLRPEEDATTSIATIDLSRVEASFTVPTTVDRPVRRLRERRHQRTST